MMAWDEPLYDPRGNPLPKGDHHWLMEQARGMFKSLGGGLDKLFSEMEQREMLDLTSRPGKAGGGFCSDLPKLGLPFIFANFNGTKDDIEGFTHEMGHAFQNYCSRLKPLSDYVWPTSEACEVHSMGLEFLAWPQMGLFFGAEADRFCKIHLLSSIAFIPYGPWANLIMDPQTHGTGMPSLKGISAEIEPALDQEVLPLLELLQINYRKG